MMRAGCEWKECAYKASVEVSTTSKRLEDAGKGEKGMVDEDEGSSPFDLAGAFGRG